MTERTYVLLVAFILSLGLFALTYERTALFIGGVIENALLPFKIAELVARPPDLTLVIPVPGLQLSDTADTWGEARSNGRTHEGQDLFAKRGTPVFSATRGYVVRVGENRLGGHIVFVLGEGGRRYYYAHLDSHEPGLTTGTFVDETSIVGYVGTTGNASGTPPHLHFGVYAERGAINPYPLLVDRNGI